MCTRTEYENTVSLRAKELEEANETYRRQRDAFKMIERIRRHGAPTIPSLKSLGVIAELLEISRWGAWRLYTRVRRNDVLLAV